jgi:hypothetical protein
MMVAQQILMLRCAIGLLLFAIGMYTIRRGVRPGFGAKSLLTTSCEGSSFQSFVYHFYRDLIRLHAAALFYFG